VKGCILMLLLASIAVANAEPKREPHNNIRKWEPVCRAEEKHGRCAVAVPEGGSALLYLSLAGLTVAGAVHMRRRKA